MWLVVMVSFSYNINKVYLGKGLMAFFWWKIKPG